MIDLREYGWNEKLEGAGASFDGAPARVVAEHRERYDVVAADGEHAATLAGRLRHEAQRRADLPAVGDWVLIDPGAGDGAAVIRHVLPRTSCFSRKVAGARTEEQIVAANIDVVWITEALDRPLSLRRLERWLTLAWESGAIPVILLTKADLAQDAEGAVLAAERVAPCVAVHAVSSVRPGGLDALSPYLRAGRTLAILGPSGAGKSTIINTLLGRSAMRVAEVRAIDHKGRHTTTHRQLLRLPDGALIVDTPGMRELQLWDADGGIEDTFADIEDIAAGCRFTDCRHESEPGCAVLEAVRLGTLDADRLESHARLRREQAWLDRRHDARAQAEEERRIRSIMRTLRHHPKYRK